MRWRNQSRSITNTRTNQTLDSFLSGAPSSRLASSSNSSTVSNQNSSHVKKIPKIKIPVSSGLPPTTPPINLPTFLYPEYP